MGEHWQFWCSGPIRARFPRTSKHAHGFTRIWLAMVSFMLINRYSITCSVALVYFGRKNLLDQLALVAEYSTSVLGVDPSCILNMDETALEYDQPPRRAFAYKGSKRVVVQYRGREKNRVTVGLCASLSGLILNPFIIFKGEQNDRIQRELNCPEYPNCASLSVNRKAWMDSVQMLRWVDTVSCRC